MPAPTTRSSRPPIDGQAPRATRCDRRKIANLRTAPGHNPEGAGPTRLPGVRPWITPAASGGPKPTSPVSTPPALGETAGSRLDSPGVARTRPGAAGPFGRPASGARSAVRLRRPFRRGFATRPPIPIGYADSPPPPVKTRSKRPTGRPPHAPASSPAAPGCQAAPRAGARGHASPRRAGGPITSGQVRHGPARPVHPSRGRCPA